MPTFTGWLRDRDDDDLVALLRERPDLASPAPGNLHSLAVRATSRTSLDRALARCDAVVLQVVEAVTVLADDEPATLDGVIAAIAGDASPDDADLVAAACTRAVRRALVWPDEQGRLRPAPGLVDCLGPYVAGLAPAGPVRAVPSPAPEPDPVAARPTGGATPPGEPLAAVLDEAPPAARAMLEALAWGPPVGREPGRGTAAAKALAWLTGRGLVVSAERGHVLLPRPVAWQVRGGRTHRGVAAPPAPPAPSRPASTVAAESAAAAEGTVLLVHHLLRAWEGSPPSVLRSGGLGVRDLRRAAAELGVDDDEAAFVVELAWAAGLVGPDETPAFAPTTDADAWLAQDLPGRWAALARAWIGTPRTPWLVGTRDERGAVRAALDPTGHRPWAPRLRLAVLGVLAQADEGWAPDDAAVLAALSWHTPRSAPPAAAVSAVLREAGRLGVLGAGALAPAGRALLAAVGADPTSRAGGPAAGTAGDDPVAAALARVLPPTVDEVLLQGDLTGVVPGRPSPALEALLADLAQVESRGGAVTVRFTPGSVRAALDRGSDADDVLARLAAVARGGVPQPLEYLVRDAARRHGALRAGAALSYLRSDDPALLAGLVDDPRLADLGLVRLAPTVLVSAAGVPDLLDAVRERGLAPVAEGPDGATVPTERAPRRARPRTRHSAGGGGVAATEDQRLRAVVAHLRAGPEEPARDDPADGPAPARGDAPPITAPVSPRAQLQPRLGRSPVTVRRSPAPGRALPPPAAPPAVPEGPPPAGGTADPAQALVLLREAAAERRSLLVEVVGPAGRAEQRLLRPVRVDGGRLRAIDEAREAELTVAVHRIAWVGPEPGRTPPSTTPEDA